MFGKCFRYSLICTLCLFLATTLGLFWLYQLKASGEVFLENTRGTAVITREPDSQIAHIRGDTIESVAYA